MAISYGQSEKVIMKIIEIFPEKVNIYLPESRCSALKLACSMIQSSSDTVIRALIKVNPEGLKEEDALGKLPIYYAMEHNQSIEIIQHMLNVMMMNHADILTDLLTEDTALDDIFQFIEKCPSALQQIDRNGDFPIHVACRRSVQSRDPQYRNDVIMKLIQLYPVAVTKPNKDGYYPLHVACERVQPDHVIIKLIEIFPEAVNNSLNESGSSPLNLACLCIKSIIVIQTLMELYPIAVQEKNNKGTCPIHNAIEGTQSNDVLQYILNLDPLAIQRQNGSGRSPLHVAVNSLDRINLLLMENMVRHSDININMKDENGSTPLHLACSLDKEFVVECLLHYPGIDLNSKNDIANSTPLHVAVREYYPNIVRNLLSHPCIVFNEKNYFNETPFDVIILRRKELKVKLYYRDAHCINCDTIKQKISKCLEIEKILDDFPIQRRW